MGRKPQLPPRTKGRPSYDRLAVENFEHMTELLEAQNTLLTRLLAVSTAPTCSKCGAGGAERTSRGTFCLSCKEGIFA